MSLRYIFLLNVLLAFIWPAWQERLTAGEVLIGFVVGFLLLAVLNHDYGRRVLAVVGFTLFLLWSIVVSSIQVARYILAPKLTLDQGIVAIPLTAERQLEIAMLATAITLTPGTLSVDVGVDAQGRRVLYVHDLVVHDPEAVRKSIKEDFEARVLRITRGREGTAS
jgi:multicomponent Na+:H+ antiporter subunit E